MYGRGTAEQGHHITYDVAVFDLQAALTSSFMTMMDNEDDWATPLHAVDHHGDANKHAVQVFDEALGFKHPDPRPDGGPASGARTDEGKGHRQREHQKRQRERRRNKNGGLAQVKPHAVRRLEVKVAFQPSTDFTMNEASFAKGAYVGRVGGWGCDDRQAFTASDAVLEGTKVIPWDGG